MVEENKPEHLITLPFCVSDLFGGLAEVNGLAKASASELILELVVKDSLLNVFKSGLKEIRVPQSEIDGVVFKRGWFGTTVRIRFKSMKWLADLPGENNAEVILIVARQDRDRAVDFVRILSPVSV